MGSGFWSGAGTSAAGGLLNFINSRNANSRAQSAEQQAIADQQLFRNQANSDVQQQIRNIATSSPQALADQATGSYVSQLRKNAAGAQSGTTSGTQTFGQSTSALPANLGADPRYAKDVAASQQQVQQYGDTAAGEMGQIDAAVRQRQNEGLEEQTLGTNLNTLNAESYGQSFVDQLRAQAAGQSNPWISLGASLLGTLGNGLSKNVGNSAGTFASNIAKAPGALYLATNSGGYGAGDVADLTPDFISG